MFSLVSCVDVYFWVMVEIIVVIEDGIGEWCVFWFYNGVSIVCLINVVFGKCYCGINMFVFWVVGFVVGYGDGFWGIYK